MLKSLWELSESFYASLGRDKRVVHPGPMVRRIHARTSWSIIEVRSKETHLRKPEMTTWVILLWGTINPTVDEDFNSWLALTHFQTTQPSWHSLITTLMLVCRDLQFPQDRWVQSVTSFTKIILSFYCIACELVFDLYPTGPRQKSNVAFFLASPVWFCNQQNSIFSQPNQAWLDGASNYVMKYETSFETKCNTRACHFFCTWMKWTFRRSLTFKDGLVGPWFNQLACYGCHPPPPPPHLINLRTSLAKFFLCVHSGYLGSKAVALFPHNRISKGPAAKEIRWLLWKLVTTYTFLHVCFKVWSVISFVTVRCCRDIVMWELIVVNSQYLLSNPYRPLTITQERFLTVLSSLLLKKLPFLTGI